MSWRFRVVLKASISIPLLFAVVVAPYFGAEWLHENGVASVHSFVPLSLGVGGAYAIFLLIFRSELDEAGRRAKDREGR